MTVLTLSLPMYMYQPFNSVFYVLHDMVYMEECLCGFANIELSRS